MKPIWYIIGIACFLISAIARMANSVSDVLVAVGIITAIGVLIWLYERGLLTRILRFTSKNRSEMPQKPKCQML